MSNKPPMLPNQLQGQFLEIAVAVPGNLIHCLPTPTPPPKKTFMQGLTVSLQDLLCSTYRSERNVQYGRTLVYLLQPIFKQHLQSKLVYVPLPSSFSKASQYISQPTHKAVQIQAKPKVRAFLRMRMHGYMPTSLKSYETRSPSHCQSLATILRSLQSDFVLTKENKGQRPTEGSLVTCAKVNQHSASKFAYFPLVAITTTPPPLTNTQTLAMNCPVSLHKEEHPAWELCKESTNRTS